MSGSTNEVAHGSVVLEGPNGATEIFLIDSTFQLRRRALGRLTGSFPAGVYKARYQLGNAIQDDLFEIRAGRRVVRRGGRVIFSTPSPLPSTGIRTRPGELEEMDPAIRRAWWAKVAALSPARGQGVLHLVLRRTQPESAYEVRAHRLGTDEQVVARWEGGVAQGPRAFCLASGTWVVSVAEGGGRLCRAVPVVPGHQTAVAMEAPREGETLAGALADSSLLFLRHPIHGKEEALLLQEAAQQALRRSRSLLEPDQLIRDRGASPWQRLLTAHAFIEAARSRARRPYDVVSPGEAETRAVLAAGRVLRESALGGTTDAAALGLLEHPPRGPVNLDVPPLLATTWRTLVAGSLAHPRAVRGGDQALRMAEHLRASSLWFLWWERDPDVPGPEQQPGLTSATEHLLDPQLRVAAGRVPAWVERPPRIAELTAANDRALARSLQLPIPLVLGLGRQMDERRFKATRARAQQRAQRLRAGEQVALVVLPDGVRVDPRHGQPLDFDAVFEAVGEALDARSVVSVRAPPVLADSKEMRAALANADVLVADLAYRDPAVRDVIKAWLALHRGRPHGLVTLCADSHPWEPAPGSPEPVSYTASFGTSVSFADPVRFDRALAQARAHASRRGGARRRRARALWAEEIAWSEQRRLDLYDLHAGMGPARAPISLLVSRAGFQSSLRREPPAVQRDVFLSLRACGDWEGMVRTQEVMAPSLKRTVLVREQYALALNRLKRSREAIAELRLVLREIGANGETCGLLGRIYKDRWLGARKAGKAGSPAARKALDQAIAWYRKGVAASPMDPYPGVNALTLLALSGTAEARRRHRRLLPQVEAAVLQRLHGRPSYWDLASMVEVAANKRDRSSTIWYLRLALAAPHDQWHRETTAQNLELLRDAPSIEFRRAAPWIELIAGALVRGRADPAELDR